MFEVNDFSPLEAALYYSEKGFSVVPISKGEKKPCIDWREFQKRMPMGAEISDWFVKFLDAQVGIVTGKISNIVVIDVDQKRGGVESVKKLKLPITYAVKTGGGGFHFYYKYNENIKTGVSICKGIDIRSDGGLVVAPPSFHKSGNKYELVVDDEIKDFPINIFTKQIGGGKKKYDWNNILYGVDKGSRNTTAAIVFGKMLSEYDPEYWESVVWPMGEAWNERCNPPLEKKELRSVFESIAKLEFKNNREDTLRVIPIEKPKNSISFDEWKKIVSDNFPDLLFPSEVGLSVVTQILIKDITNPFALVFVGMPAAGKTIVLNFFSRINNITYGTDNFTPAAFVSQAVNVKKEKLKYVDLLPRIKNKTLLVRDMATILSKPDENLRQNLGILTRLLDGEGLSVDGGVHGQRKYEGEYLFMLLAASTPILPRVWQMMGNLGSRLFFLNIKSNPKSNNQLADQLINLTYKEKEKVCWQATDNLIRTLWHNNPNGVIWNKNINDEKYRLIVARCARLLARLRATVNIVKSDYESESFIIPIVEQPDRVNQLLFNLCRGHAVACGRDSLNETDLSLAIEVAIDSAPFRRVEIFRSLLNNKGILSTSAIESLLGCSKPTAIKEMSIFKVLGVCEIKELRTGYVGNVEKILCLHSDFDWFLSDEYKLLTDKNL